MTVDVIDDHNVLHDMLINFTCVGITSWYSVL